MPRAPVFVEVDGTILWCGEMISVTRITGSDAARAWLLLAIAGDRIHG